MQRYYRILQNASEFLNFFEYNLNIVDIVYYKYKIN